MLAMISTLQNMGVEDREIYLYDTFEGMPEPSEHDVSELEPPALETWRQAEQTDDRAWSYLFDPSTFNEDAVRELLTATGYPTERMHFVRGLVEETIPGEAPEELALLRLDTDWYDSTVHEMRHLYPRLASGGVLIVDDFGHWQGLEAGRGGVLRRGRARPPADPDRLLGAAGRQAVAVGRRRAVRQRLSRFPIVRPSGVKSGHGSAARCRVQLAVLGRTQVMPGLVERRALEVADRRALTGLTGGLRSRKPRRCSGSRGCSSDSSAGATAGGGRRARG